MMSRLGLLLGAALALSAAACPSKGARSPEAEADSVDAVEHQQWDHQQDSINAADSAAAADSMSPVPTIDSLTGIGPTSLSPVDPARFMLARLASWRGSVVRVAPDSTVTLKTQVWARNLAAGDTLRFTYARNDSIQVTHRSRAGTDQAQVGAPAYGQTASYRGCVQLERGGRSSGRVIPSQPLCWSQPWVYTRPALPTPPPVIDSVKQLAAILVKPDSWIVTPAMWKAKNIYADSSGRLVDSTGAPLGFSCPQGARCPQEVFCAYGRQRDGQLRMLAPQDTMKVCRTRFDSLPGHAPSYAPF